MSKILPIYIAAIILSWGSHMSSLYDPRNEKYKTKDVILYSVLVLVVSVFAGLRYAYNDTATYVKGYELLDVSAGWLIRIDPSPSAYPGFVFLNCLMKLCGFSSQSFIMFYSVVTIGIYLWFLRKYTNNIPLTVFLFFTLGCYGFILAAIKQCLATALCLIAIDRWLQRKKGRFVLYIILAVGFHPFAVVFLICPLLGFRPWTRMFVWMIGICAIAGLSMQTWLGRAVNLLSMVGVDYDMENLTASDGVNIFRVLVVWAPIMLSYICRNHWRRSNDRFANMIMNLSALCAELMFIALFGNPVYFGRLANFFLIFQAISLPYMLRNFESTTRKVIAYTVVVCYVGYFVYGEVFNGASFDSVFARVTLYDYFFAWMK